MSGWLLVGNTPPAAPSAVTSGDGKRVGDRQNRPASRALNRLTRAARTRFQAGEPRLGKPIINDRTNADQLDPAHVEKQLGGSVYSLEPNSTRIEVCKWR